MCAVKNLIGFANLSFDSNKKITEMWRIACVVLAIVVESAKSAHWVTEHHDIRNSGLADSLDGPAEVETTCTKDILRSSEFAYSSTGSLSINNEYLFVGRCVMVLVRVAVSLWLARGLRRGQ